MAFDFLFTTSIYNLNGMLSRIGWTSDIIFGWKVRNQISIVIELSNRSALNLKASFKHNFDHIMTTATETVTKTAESWLDQAQYFPPDAIFALTAQYIEDLSPNKVNLGQGTYRDDEGKPWILPSIQLAREKLLSQDLNHEYLPILGLLEFRERAAEVALGSKIFAEQKDNVRSCSPYKMLLLVWITS